MASMRELANHIISVANDSEKNITNLQLQKVMFFIFGRMVSFNGIEDALVNETYDQQFRRWSYGPVIESIYFDYNHFGGRPIDNKSVQPSDEYTQYNNDIEHLLDIDPFKLVEATHKLPSWANFKEEIEKRDFVPPYDLEDFAREFIRHD